ncbi:eCIS core domain-containing protein [Planktothrix agardhii]|uniref:eCIS core domain-containing protein n=1 Tax=Planktothrix agardhii TaxID=1160 RepID=UPI002B214D9C|nr:DUF4157 domain-containing protein [Planktothrix agardhii]MEA5561289.1 DUF4157 domain-containing protein [Planktothrix agardhii UHCC 0887]
MKAFQRKRNIQNTHHDIQPVQAQFQSRPFAEPQAETKSVSENTSSLQSGNSKPGFNFAEIPLYPTQPQVTAPVQPKFTFAQAKLESSIVQREEQEEEPQAKLESGIAQRSEEEEEPQAKLESGMVQRSEEEEEEPQAKLESGIVQRSEEDDEPQAKLESGIVQRSEEEEEPQAKLESGIVQRSEEDDEPQAKLESGIVQRSEEDDEPQAKLESGIVQRSEEDDEPQAKLESGIVQRSEEDDEPAQMKAQSLPVISENKGLQSNRQFPPMQVKLNLAPRDSVQSLPIPVQRKMEWAFNTDFSGVRVHTGPQAKQIQAKAFTQGSDIHFQPDQYNPHSQQGQELLGHELTHVVQQRAGRVNKKPQSKGNRINFDYQLEAEADNLGAKASQGERVEVLGAKSLPKLYSSKTIQRKTQQLTPLPDNVVTTGKLLSNKTEKIQKKIIQYNQIPLNDKDYDKHEKILDEIHTETALWLKEKGDKDSRSGSMKELKHQIKDEKSKIKQQKSGRDMSINEAFGETINTVTFGAGAKGFIEDMSQNIQQGENLSAGEVIANRSLNYAELIKASPVSSIGGSVVSFLVSAYNVYDSYSIRKALKTAAMAKNKIDPDSVDWNNLEEVNKYFASQPFDYNAILNDDKVMQSAEYGYAKVTRRFYRSIYHTVNSFIKMIADILCVTGIGTIPGVIIKTAQGVLKFAEVAMDKIKGFIKIITGRRGVGRKINAENIVEAAFTGNQKALQLLVDLDPIGLLFRVLGPTGKKQMIKKPTNTKQMMELLENTRSDPENYGTEGQFISAVAEQLKSS